MLAQCGESCCNHSFVCVCACAFEMHAWAYPTVCLRVRINSMNKQPDFARQFEHRPVD